LSEKHDDDDFTEILIFHIFKEKSTMRQICCHIRDSIVHIFEIGEIIT